MSIDDTVPARHFQAERLSGNPIIHSRLDGFEDKVGENINGPSLIRVPDWIENPLGRYYLYFAHHCDDHIRMAYSDKLEGPWKVYSPGILHLADAPGCGHIASPDVHIEEDNQRIRMYFHQPARAENEHGAQVSFVAFSNDGLSFEPNDEILGSSYFRVFQYGEAWYAFAMNSFHGGIVYKSDDGISDFLVGPQMIQRIRHNGLFVEGDTLFLFFSRAGDTPERILLTTIDLTADWKDWCSDEIEEVLEAEEEWEGGNLPLERSSYGTIRVPGRQLRDPGVFQENGQTYLLYSVAGEQGIGIAKLNRIRPQ
ncbi:MAG: hypothetical protein O3B01_11465 [Planctomycetota bacterium]|nr:hypothetical protein [Planctomycetota bacterium]MDA1139192.1 hypothetical protein [Planctomycetota bacterium]